MPIMNECQIEFEQLLDFYEGRSHTTKAGALNRHVAAGCASCRSRLDWFAVFIPALHRAITEELPIAPAHALERAWDIARDRQHTPGPSILVKLATLLFDSRQMQPAFGSRHAGLGDIQLVYSTDSHDVDLWQERQTRDGWYLIGQVVPRQGGEPISPEQVELTAPDGLRLTAVTEAREFRFADVPTGSYEIKLRVPDQDIVLPGVTIGPV